MSGKLRKVRVATEKEQSTLLNVSKRLSRMKIENQRVGQICQHKSYCDLTRSIFSLIGRDKSYIQLESNGVSGGKELSLYPHSRNEAT